MSAISTSDSESYETDDSGPISLQDQCFIYILAHLKDYPSDLLALLPKTWRTKLLKAAPPLQLHKLETTSLSEGIDTDVFWHEMSNLKDTVWVNYIVTESEGSHDHSGGSHDHNGGSQEPLKARFINYICHMLLSEANRKYAIMRISEFLLAVHKDRLDRDVVHKMTTTHIPTQFMFTPPYYFIPFRCPRYREEQLASLMISVGTFPTALEIHGDQMAKALWSVPREGYNLIGKLFQKLKFLRFYCMRSYCTPLNLIMSSFYKHERQERPSPMSSHTQNCSIESLEFHDVCRESVACLADHFSTAKCFKNLKRLRIELIETVPQMFSKLAGIVSSQHQNLEGLTLSSLVSNQYSRMVEFSEHQFYSSLANFVSKAQFRRLILDNFRNIPQSMVEKLLLSFFKTEPEHKQTVCIRNSTIKKCGTVPFRIKLKDKFSIESKSTLATSIACTAYKNVSFENVTVPFEFFTWFEQLGSVYLHSLDFSDITVVPQVPSREIIVTQSNDRYVSDAGRTKDKTPYYEQDKSGKAKLPESIDPRLVFYTHPGFRCIKFSWSQVDD